jgi:hypothetical protein
MANEGRQPTMIAVWMITLVNVRKLDYESKANGTSRIMLDIPTAPSIPAHKINHAVLTCPPLTLEFRETTLTIAKTIVIMPTIKTTPTLNFSTTEIRRFQSTRSGIAMTEDC